MSGTAVAFIKSPYMKIIHSLVFVLWLAIPAIAQIPALPEIPTALPDAIREPLIVKRKPLAEQKLALLEEGNKINQECKNLEKGSPPYQDCLKRQGSFTSAVAALGVKMQAMQNEIDDAVDAEIAKLTARDQELTTALEKDAGAIRNLGFARRAEDFAEWEKLGADAKAQFEKEVIDAATDKIAGAVSDHLLDSFKNLDAATASRWIGQLNKMEPKPSALIQLIQKVGNAADKAAMVEDAKAILAGLERLQQTSAANTREEMLTLSMDLICDVVPPPGDQSCNAFKTVGKLTFASLYNNAARRVALNEVERLTTMTEQQLRALAKLNELMVKHVKERNEVRKKLEELNK